MKTVETIINETLSGRVPIDGAVNQLLSEDISSGDTVVSIDDKSSYPYQGMEGKAKGPSAKGSGFLDVDYNGVTVPMVASLLIKRQST
jgi:hypothetical protein